MEHIKVIAFDADDTLWVNEPYFRETESRFCELLSDYLSAHAVEQELLRTEIANIPSYGYGIKAFTLSLIETALRIGGDSLDIGVISRLIALGKEQLDRDVELLPDVEQVLRSLQGRYRLVVATKGDLLDQERKLQRSGLLDCFHHVEIMSEKGEQDYVKLLRHLDVRPEEFMMVGNSLKSDILPVLQLGGWGVHVPFHTTWALEQVHHEHHLAHTHFREVRQMSEILPWLS